MNLFWCCSDAGKRWQTMCGSKFLSLELLVLATFWREKRRKDEWRSQLESLKSASRRKSTPVDSVATVAIRIEPRVLGSTLLSSERRLTWLDRRAVVQSARTMICGHRTCTERTCMTAAPPKSVRRETNLQVHLVLSHDEAVRVNLMSSSPNCVWHTYCAIEERARHQTRGE